MTTLHDPTEEARAAVLTLFRTWSESGPLDVECALAPIAEEFTGIGTGPGDYYPNREAVGALYLREKSQMPDAETSFEVAWMHARLLRPDLALVECQLRSDVSVGDQTHRIEPRSSFVLEHQGGRWLVVHFHFSEPDPMQAVGGTLADALERRNRVLEREVAERTAELAAALDGLKAAQARLVQQEKMASLGQLTAGIAHEIKNPLNFVTNFADLSVELVEELEAETGPDERAALLSDLRTNAEAIAEHGRRADAIVRSMMAHARSGVGHRRRVDLRALIDEVVDRAAHGRRARDPGADVRVIRDLPDLGKVEVVPDEVARVFINLLDNAFDAVSDRGEPPDAPGVRVLARRRGDAVDVRVEDDGPGMDEAVRARAFEPFFTTKPPGRGTGLGLSLSYDVVTQGHGGALTIESEPGHGTAVVVTLPADPSE